MGNELTQAELIIKRLEEAVAKFMEMRNQIPDKWLTGDEAMRRLGITSKTTLQKYRDEGRIRYSQPDRKVILYDADSINAFIEKHVREPFNK